MANLETLELTIKANAESASQGIQKLIGSLNFFRTSVGKSVSGLKQLNAELDKLKKSGGLKLPNLSNGVSRTAKTISDATKQAQAIEEWKRNRKPLTISHFRDNDRTEEEQREAFPQWFRKPGSRTWRRNLREANDILRLRNGQMNIASDPSTLKQFFEDSPKKEVKSELMEYLNKSPDYKNLGAFINQNLGIGAKGKSAKDSASVFEQAFGDKETLKELKQTAPATVEAMKEEAKAVGEIGKNSESASKKGKGFFSGVKSLGKDIKSLLPKFNLLNRVMRIASTMLIRMGVKALFKGAKEGFNNFYEYSKATGGQFAKEMDGVFSAWGQIKNQMGASLATVFSAALPIINSIASAAITAFNYLSQLIALLTGKSSWTKATEQVGSYADAIESANTGKGGGGGGMKELLANFDELNVIASESGGGGGGGAAAAANEYETMFEEMNQFDSKIREIADVIKEVVGWVRDNMDIVLATVGLIGLAILGWKISKAFDGALGTLGKIVAGGALVTLGVILSFDFGKKVGSSIASGKKLSWADIFEGVVGVAVAALGGYMIGGGFGAVVGLSIALSAFIAGVIVGWEDENDKLKWGNTELTPEKVHEFVKSQFSFDIDAEIKLVGGRLENARAAKAHLSQEIYEFGESLYKIKIGIDTSPEAIETAKEKLLSVIGALKESTTATENLITAYLQVMPYEQEGEDNAIKSINFANLQLNEYFETQGKKAAELFDKGMQTGWAEGEQEQILALMEHMNNIFTGAQSERAGNAFVVSSKLNLKDMTRDTAKQVLEDQKESIKTFRKTMEDTTAESAEEFLYYADLSDRAGLIDSETGRALGDIYREQAAFLVDGFEDAYELKLKESKKTMKQSWIDALSDVYGADYLKVIKQGRANFDADLKKAFIKNKDEDATKKVIQKYLARVLDVGITKDASDLFEIDGWELLADDAKNKFFSEVFEALGVDSVRMLKESLNISATEIINISGWDQMSTMQRLTFIKAMKDAYGSQEAVTALRSMGINVAEEISKGMTDNSTSAHTVRKAANDLAREFEAEIQQIHPEISATASLEVKINALINISTTVGNGVVKGANAVITNGLSAIKNIAPKAAGGFVGRGDLFIANEQGAELIGSIGGSTAVANQGQIIEGISSGVERANSEQNALLREQNNLLRGILEKETSVNFGASAQFGRTVKRSLDMYSMVGG